MQGSGQHLGLVDPDRLWVVLRLSSQLCGRRRKVRSGQSVPSALSPVYNARSPRAKSEHCWDEGDAAPEEYRTAKSSPFQTPSPPPSEGRRYLRCDPPLMLALRSQGGVRACESADFFTRLLPACFRLTTCTQGNSNFHGARPVHLIITMIKWIRTSRSSRTNFVSAPPPRTPVF